MCCPLQKPPRINPSSIPECQSSGADDKNEKSGKSLKDVVLKIFRKPIDPKPKNVHEIVYPMQFKDVSTTSNIND